MWAWGHRIGPRPLAYTHWLLRPLTRSAQLTRSLNSLTRLPSLVLHWLSAKGESESISLLQRLRRAVRKVLCKQPTRRADLPGPKIGAVAASDAVAERKRVEALLGMHKDF